MKIPVLCRLEECLNKPETGLQGSSHFYYDKIIIGSKAVYATNGHILAKISVPVPKSERFTIISKNIFADLRKNTPKSSDFIEFSIKKIRKDNATILITKMQNITHKETLSNIAINGQWSIESFVKKMDEIIKNFSGGKKKQTYAGFNPEYLFRLSKALGCDYSKGTKGVVVKLLFGDSETDALQVVNSKRNEIKIDGVGLMMPVRWKDDKSAWCKEHK